MTTNDLTRSLPAIFGELVHGARDFGFVLNAGDAGLLASVQRLSADEAGASLYGGATIAAHVDHLRYGLSLMNRWAGREPNPFAEADWSAAWQTRRVTEDEWQALQDALRTEADRWRAALGTPREVSGVELDGVIGSIAHLAYHLGAIRQIQATTRGPKEGLPPQGSEAGESAAGEPPAR